VYFRILGRISNVETIGIGAEIREIARLRRHYGRARWRKRKGVARVELSDRAVRFAEVHWYEGTGIGRRELKLKRFLD
jgi:hypothetical protein